MHSSEHFRKFSKLVGKTCTSNVLQLQILDKNTKINAHKNLTLPHVCMWNCWRQLSTMISSKKLQWKGLCVWSSSCMNLFSIQRIFCQESRYFYRVYLHDLHFERVLLKSKSCTSGSLLKLLCDKPIWDLTIFQFLRDPMNNVGWSTPEKNHFPSFSPLGPTMTGKKRGTTEKKFRIRVFIT